MIGKKSNQAINIQTLSSKTIEQFERKREGIQANRPSHV